MLKLLTGIREVFGTCLKLGCEIAHRADESGEILISGLLDLIVEIVDGLVALGDSRDVTGDGLVERIDVGLAFRLNVGNSGGELVDLLGRALVPRFPISALVFVLLIS